MNSASLPLSIAMLAFITLPNNCLLFIALVQFCAESLSKNKINATPLLLLVSLSFIIVTFTTLPYLENIRYKSLLVREKGRLDTYTVLLLGANPPLISSSGVGPGGGPEKHEPSAHLGLNPDRTSLLAAATASRVPGGVARRRREGSYHASSRLSFVPNSLNVASYVNIC